MIYIYLHHLFKILALVTHPVNGFWTLIGPIAFIVFVLQLWQDDEWVWLLYGSLVVKRELRVKLLVSWVIHITGLCYWCALWILTKLMRLQLQEMEMNISTCAYEDSVKSSFSSAPHKREAAEVIQASDWCFLGTSWWQEDASRADEWMVI